MHPTTALVFRLFCCMIAFIAFSAGWMAIGAKDLEQATWCMLLVTSSLVAAGVAPCFSNLVKHWKELPGDVRSLFFARVISSGIALIPFCVAWAAAQNQDVERAVLYGLLAVVCLIVAEGVAPAIMVLTWPREAVREAKEAEGID